MHGFFDLILLWFALTTAPYWLENHFRHMTCKKSLFHMLKPTTTNHQHYPLKSRFLFCPFCFKSTACFSEKPQKHFPCHCGFMHWSQHTLPRPLTREQSVWCDSPVQSPAQQVSLSCFCCCCDTVPFSLSHLLCLSLFHRPSLFLAPSHFGLPFPILR